MNNARICRRTLLALTCPMSGLAALPPGFPGQLHASPSRGQPAYVTHTLLRADGTLLG